MPLTLPPNKTNYNFGYNTSYMFVKNYQVGGKKGASSNFFFFNKKIQKEKGSLI